MLRDFGGLKKKLVLVGQGNKIEIWSADHWQQRLDLWREEGAALLDSEALFDGLSV
jgi:MraZ protein